MQITQIILKKTYTNDKLKGIASLTVSNMFAIHDIKLLSSDPSKKYFLGMPSKKLKDSYIDIVHPINREVREHLEKILFEKMEQLENSDQNSMKFIYVGNGKNNFLKQESSDFVLEGEAKDESKHSIFKWFKD